MAECSATNNKQKGVTMSLLAQEPQTIGKVVDSGLKLFRAGFRQVLGLSVLAAVVLMISDPTLSSMAGLASWQSGVLYVVGILLYFACYLGITRMLADIARGETPAGFGSYLRLGISRLWPALVAVLLYMLAIAVGLVLLVIPGLILMGSLMLGMYLIVLEDKGGVAALKRSHQLVWGNWWRAMTVFTVALLIYMAGAMAVGAIGVAVAAGGGISLGQSEQETAQALAAVFVVFNALLSIVFSPLLLSVIVALYQDLKLRKDGGDLAARIEALGTT